MCLSLHPLSPKDFFWTSRIITWTFSLAFPASKTSPRTLTLERNTTSGENIPTQPAGENWSLGLWVYRRVSGPEATVARCVGRSLRTPSHPHPNSGPPRLERNLRRLPRPCGNARARARPRAGRQIRGGARRAEDRRAPPAGFHPGARTTLRRRKLVLVALGYARTPHATHPEQSRMDPYLAQKERAR